MCGPSCTAGCGDWGARRSWWGASPRPTWTHNTSCCGGPGRVFAIVFGLSMDYEVFLLTRVKEVFDKTGRNDHATMEGLSATASTITSAAAIMILVFGTFAFSRVLAVQLVGFGLAAAVLLDATLIRMVLVPAIMHIAGRWNWWPGVRAPKLERDDSS